MTALPVLSRSAATAQLLHTLARAPAERLTGVLRVQGNPGGVIHLNRGSVIAVESPGAPDVVTLLLRSGRVVERDWGAVFRAGMAGGDLGAELVARRLAAPAQLHVMCMMAALDAAFAVAAGRIDGCVIDGAHAPAVLPVGGGIEPDMLMGETERRIRALGAARVPLSPYRDRVARVAPLGDTRVLELANGRRSCRDLAFLLGRGLYAVTVEVSRLLAAGSVELVPREEPPPQEPEKEPLPRRRKGASGITDVRASKPAARLRTPFRLKARTPDGEDQESKEKPP